MTHLLHKRGRFITVQNKCVKFPPSTSIFTLKIACEDRVLFV